MLFPPDLYLLRQRDLQSEWLEVIAQIINNQNAGLTATAFRLVPAGQALVLTALQLRSDPGAGQNVLAQQLDCVSPAGNFEVRLKRDETALAADINGHIDWQGEIVITEGWRVRGVSTFNAGVAVNAVDLSLFGVLIPLGNLVRPS